MDKTELLREREGYRDIVEDLKSELAAMTVTKDGWAEKYAEVVRLLNAWENYINFTSDEVLQSGQPNMIPGGPGSFRFEAFIKLRRLRKAFLTTPATEDVVVVRREDIELTTQWFDEHETWLNKQNRSSADEIFEANENLKAALGEKP